MNQPPRESKHHNAEQRRYDKELRENPPIVIWEPGKNGIMRAKLVKDPDGKPGRGKYHRPTCDCDLHGAPRRTYGPQHDKTCGRHREAT